MRGGELDWVDAAIRPAAPLASSLSAVARVCLTAIRWWDTEFWNNRATWALVRAVPPSRTRRFRRDVFPLDRETGRAWVSRRHQPTSSSPAGHSLPDRRRGARVAARARRHSRRRAALPGCLADDRPRRGRVAAPARPATLRVYAQNDRAETLELTTAVQAPRTRSRATPSGRRGRPHQTIVQSDRPSASGVRRPWGAGD